MIIPLGHEQTAVRRLPWVSFSLMILCTLVLAFAQNAKVTEEDVDRAVEKVVKYYAHHPYLTLDPELAKQLGLGSEQQMTAVLDQMVSMLQAQAPTPEDQAEQQAELDRLMEVVKSTANALPVQRLGLVPADRRPLTFLSYMFMHAGFFHLLGNLFMLYLCGPFIEDLWGRRVFLGFYLAAGIFAGFMYVLHYPDATGPLVGASGAVSAVMGAFLVRLWWIKIKFFYWFGLVFRGTFQAPAWAMLPLWFAGELFNAWITDSMTGAGGGGVAYWAHIWGFVFGLAFALIMRYGKLEERFKLGPPGDEEVPRDPALDRAEKALKENHPEVALRILQEAHRRSPDDTVLAAAYWDLAVTLERAPEAAPAFARVVREDAQRGETDAALLGWLQLRDHAPQFQLDPATRVKMLEALTQAGRNLEAAPLLDQIIADLPPAPPLGLLLKLARAADRMDHPGRIALLDQAIAHSELPPATRSDLEARLLRRVAFTWSGAGAVPMEIPADIRDSDDPLRAALTTSAVFGGMEVPGMGPLTGLMGQDSGDPRSMAGSEAELEAAVETGAEAGTYRPLEGAASIELETPEDEERL